MNEWSETLILSEDLSGTTACHVQFRTHSNTECLIGKSKARTKVQRFHQERLRLSILRALGLVVPSCGS